MNKEMLEFLFVGPLFSVYKKLNNIERLVQNMATQAEVNALSERLGEVSTQLSKGLSEVVSEIQTLKDEVAAGEPVDLSTLESKVGAIAGQAQALDDIVPDVIPEPEPETPSEPEVPVEDTPVDPTL